jgi:hypothetical protein
MTSRRAGSYTWCCAWGAAKALSSVDGAWGALHAVGECLHAFCCFARTAPFSRYVYMHWALNAQCITNSIILEGF